MKALLEYDNTEGFDKQREFLQGLVGLLNDGLPPALARREHRPADMDVFMKSGGLQAGPCKVRF